MTASHGSVSQENRLLVPFTLTIYNFSYQACERASIHDPRKEGVMQGTAVNDLIALLPDHAGSFEKTQYPLPVKTAILGEAPLDTEDIRKELEAHKNGDIRDVLEPALLAAEWVESVQADRHQRFIDDVRLQGIVFMGSKWQAGWALVLGDNRHEDHVRMLIQRELIVFTDHPGLEKTIFIGDRSTSLIYFLQVMVRYGLIWGRIAPGDDHSLGHFLETDMPGFICITGDLPPLTHVIALGLMKLGAPAVVPENYPFPYGNYVVSTDPEAMIAAIRAFPNLRVRYDENDEAITLPAGCNTAYTKETFPVANRLGGTGDSFFFLRKSEGPLADITVADEPTEGIGILVEIDSPVLSLDVEETIELDAVKAVSFISGVKASMAKGILTIELRSDTKFDQGQIAAVIRQGIRMKYPLLKTIGVTFIGNGARLAETAEIVSRKRAERRRYVADMTEENTEDFAVCTECRPFSLEHTCILAPDRLPMCASRSFHTVKAAALFGSTVHPYKRQSEQHLPLRSLVAKGQTIDGRKGEYEGTNTVYREMTAGKLQRVQLHSLREFPPTSCGCFQNLAFWIEEVGGIGIMSRASSAVAPDGSHWYELANRAGGKQMAGILGVSTSYIRSENFLKADGALANVVWMDEKLKSRVADALPDGAKVATEKDVKTLDELKAFLGR